ncbi:helix-turn-helix transcriptional regulator [Paenibacillus jilunlii]|uniref:AraC family transcriptional regulator n=1 Tax=Paenibacillus jilunlii TaxID=682956 RepID=A0A1G9R165_9BACL|nr:helix-turn-helix domain-containing protein [Paenibacillus jilunlii]KWX77272.1 AraC family transcriptional regulator [Paenibacillus jilunlii]SDM16195.1 AraC-type DNA-binding protein [Paenibacillus jilunlii]
MRLNKAGNKRALYSRILVSMTLCVSLTFLASTIIYYNYYIGVEKTQAFRSDLGNLTQTSKEVVNMTDAAQSLSFQIYRNSTVSKIVFYDKPDIYDVTAAMSELGNYLSSMPYIESIYVYNPKSAKLYIASSHGQNGVFAEQELVDRNILDILNHYRDYKPFTPIPRVYSNGAAENDQVRAYTFLCYDAIGWDRAINSAVIVNISAPWINKEITSPVDSKSDTFILADQGKLLSVGSLEPHGLSPLEAAWVQQRIQGREAGYFIGEFGGVNSLISYTAPDDLSWQYVRITPYDIITKQTNSIRNATLLIAALIFVGGLAFSWLMSRRVYLPIDRIVREMNILECEKRDSMFTIRQNTLRDLILGLKPLQSIQQVEKLRQLGIHFTFNDDYRLILLRIDNYQEFRESRSSYLLAYKFAIMNIASEICGQTYRVETVDMNDDGILVLLNIVDPKEYTDTELIETLLRQIQQACSDYLKVSLTLAYSHIDRNPVQLHQLYKRVREASNHRLFYGHGCIISAQSICALQANLYHYPTEKEKKLTDALMSGKIDEAREQFSSIIRETADYPFPSVQLAVSRLSVTIKEIIINIQKRNRLQNDGTAELPALDSVETVDALEQAFFALFSEMHEQLAEKKSSKQHDLVRQINQKINDAYMEPGLSLNQIADELDMSPIYISRLYKQQTLTSIVDVILEVRMREVCSLLESTALPVTTIAERCGFTSSSYLHRMFKRSFGTTPTDYRRSRQA